MTINEMAKRLHGREYGCEITQAEALQAKRSHLVVVFGYSDDNMELRGAIDDEIGCWGDTKVYVDGSKAYKMAAGECGSCRLYQKHVAMLPWIQALRGNDCFWYYQTSLPHAEFDVFEDGELYCRGIVCQLPQEGSNEQQG